MRWRVGEGSWASGHGRYPNPPLGASLYYFLKDKPRGEVRLEILDAGLVRLDPRDGCDRSLVHDYDRLIRQVGIGLGHPHVHGANLGLRASVWHAVGGFAPLTVGEDRDLSTRVVASGACALGVDDNHVVTSARRDGRAPGGFAALLESLDPG